jgi:hypothetical protein
MHVETHEHHAHHEMPTDGRELTSVAISATLHCLTGCAIGEIAGMIIGTAAGLSNGGTIAISIVLAFVFGYGLTSLPLLRAGLALAVVAPIAFASDTLSIATMEAVDNTILVVIPGAMNAGLGTLLFWGSLAFSLVIAGCFAVPVNRWLIGRGKGHAVVHETGIHGGPPVRLVAIAAAIAFVFGSAVLVAEALDGSGMGHGGEGAMSASEHAAAPVRGLSVSADGMSLDVARNEIAAGRPTDLAFTIEGSDGRPVTEFEVEHERRMHFIVVRRDMTGFQHIHPALGRDGVWHVRLALAEPGSYRVFADFKHDGENETLASDLAVDGAVDWRPMPVPAATADAGDGYRVSVNGTTSRAGHEADLRFAVTRDGTPVQVEPYLGARGHLVALRQGDLAYLHVHPAADTTAFMTEFPTAGRYRLFLQFKDAGRVRTAAFTRVVTR